MITIKELIVQIEKFLAEADIIIDGSKSNGTIRLIYSSALLKLVMEHLHAYLALVKMGRYSTCCALQRVIYEGFIRALWIKSCATDEEINLFMEHDRLYKTQKNSKGKFIEYNLKELAKIIVPHLGDDISVKIYEKFGKIFNSFTHGGLEQIRRNSSNGYIESNHQEYEIKFLAEFGFGFAMLCLIQIGEIISKKEEVDKLIFQFHLP